ncbi:MAG: aminofutalosine synthase MqnE [Deltaproteobacteria bacterium]|nr:MAG: aminofutalosine synthase MqnE [Deltaproteobacteria bacterium]
MTSFFTDKRLEAIFRKIEREKRLNFDDGMALYETTDLIGLGHLADTDRRRRHGDKAYWVYNQHLNYTNVCANRCQFCAFARDAGEDGAYTFSIADIEKQLTARIDEPVRELHVVGGINPALPFDYYLDMIKTIKAIRPGVTVKAFTAVEIDNLAAIAGRTHEETIAKLKTAGLEMMPGGGAEVMSRRVHQKLFHRKIDHERWLDVMKIAHKSGIITNATMLYGHIETLAERVHHLLTLRELQDETGGFSAFIPLAFHSAHTRLPHLPATTAYDDLKNIAVARLLLDNIDHIKAYWVMIGEKLAQVALAFGADDLDGTIIEEKITHMAGARSARGLTRSDMTRMITTAGFTPVQRDSFYHPVKESAPLP